MALPPYAPPPPQALHAREKTEREVCGRVWPAAASTPREQRRPDMERVMDATTKARTIVQRDPA